MDKGRIILFIALAHVVSLIFTMIPEQPQEPEVWSEEKLRELGMVQPFILSEQWMTMKTFWYLLLQKASALFLLIPIFISSHYIRFSLFLIMLANVYNLLDYWIFYNDPWPGGLNYDFVYGVLLCILTFKETVERGL